MDTTIPITDLLKGAWSAVTAYTIGDIVTSSGSSYICIANHTNHVPPNATYWSLLAASGVTSGPGTTVDSEIVLFNGTTGLALKRATGSGLVKVISGVYSTITDPTSRVTTLEDQVTPPAAPSVDLTANGIKIALTAGEDLVFGNATYFKADGKMGKADADAIATAGAVALALATIANNASGSFLLHGVIRNDAWNWTVGGIIYLSTTAGDLTQTAPSGTDDVIQILGIATHADRMYFNPQLVQIEHV